MLCPERGNHKRIEFRRDSQRCRHFEWKGIGDSKIENDVNQPSRPRHQESWGTIYSEAHQSWRVFFRRIHVTRYT